MHAVSQQTPESSFWIDSGFTYLSVYSADREDCFSFLGGAGRWHDERDTQMTYLF